MVSVFVWALLFIVGHAACSPVWPPFHQPPKPHNMPPPLHHAPAPLAAQNLVPQLDAIDKCLFTCDHCYKHPQVLITCANECIFSGGEVETLDKVWLQTCPQFLMPIYFDYQSMDQPM